MKTLWGRIRLWWQAAVQDRSEDVPFPLTADEWAVIQQYETKRQAMVDAKAPKQETPATRLPAPVAFPGSSRVLAT